MRFAAIAIVFLAIATFLATSLNLRGTQVWWFGSEAIQRYDAGNQNPVTAQTVTNGGIGSNIAYPALSGRVVDNAGLINSSQRAQLTARLEAFENASSDQLVVATIPSLNGRDLEGYANGLFRHWQLGQAGQDNGVLLLVARDDRKIRIEVGYGLEGVLTDAISRVIIETAMVPRFRAGQFGEGILEASDLLVKVLSGDVAEVEARKQRFENNRSSDVDWEFWIFFTIWGVLFFGPVGFAILAPIFGEKIGNKRYRWLGIETTYGSSGRRSSGGWSGGSGGGWSGGGGGGFSGGGGSSGGGGASGGW